MQKTDYEKLFLEKYNNLNAAQKKAVDTIEGPVMVIAGPGTGKTTILTLRIANILRQTDTPPSGILAITFTEAGVRAMKQKLREIIGSRAEEVRIHTFHGFAAAVIAEFPEHFTNLRNTKQMTDIDTETLLRGLLEREEFSAIRPFGDPDFYIEHVKSLIRDAKKEALTPEMVEEFARSEMERIASDEASISSRGASKGELKADAKRAIEKAERTVLAARIYQLYEEGKKEQRLIDYDDLIFELSLAMGRDDLLLQSLQEKFLYLLVDEHQDTNDTQNLIIEKLAAFYDNPNVFIVGDEKQAVFRFQGASVGNFLRFRHKWRDIQVIALADNYRSSQGILDASFSMIEANYADGEHAELRIRLRGRDGGEPVALTEAPDIETAESFLVLRLHRVLEEDEHATVALIVKTNREVERLLRLCAAEGVPAAAERSVNVFAHPIGLAFFSLIAFAIDFSRADRLGETLASGLWGFPFEQRTVLLRQLRKGAEDAVLAALPMLGQVSNALRDDDPVGFLVRLAELSGLNALILADPTYVEVWRSILKLAEGLAQAHDIDDARSLIERLLAYQASSENRSVKLKLGAVSARVTVMTAHSSKGLEFDHVFIPYATDESWNSRRRPKLFILPVEAASEEGDDVRDARRLFYVALTRAKRSVDVIVPLSFGAGESLSPARFIDELDTARVMRTVIDKVADRSLPKAPPKTDRHSKILDYMRRELLETGLSVTALNNFLECPSAFIYRSVLRIPELPNPAAEKGSALHKAIDRIWHLEDRSTQSIEDTITEVAGEYIGNSWLRPFEKKKVLEEITRQAPIMAKSLENHFSERSKVWSEIWSETKHSYMIESDSKEPVEIILHGKLDAIIDDGDRALVFDYKSKEAMSENEIRGLTKNSNGNYFRQLVFYVMLVSNDRRFTGRSVVPSLIFLTPDAKGICQVKTLPITFEDVLAVQEQIKELVESIWSGSIMDTWCESPDCEHCAKKKLL